MLSLFLILAKALRYTLAMAALPTQQLFTSFHTRTTQLPAEINRLIIDYTDPSLFPQDHPTAEYAPIARVSRALRQAYLDYRR